MRILKWLAIVVVVLIVIGAGLYAYLGGFKKIAIERGSFGGAEIVYATHVGPYSKLAQAWSRFQKEWEAAGLETCDSIAAYLDAPGTPPEKLRSVIGCRIDALSEDEKAALKGKFKSLTLPASEAYVAAFPFKNFLSFWVAPSKIYPAMMKRAKADGTTPALAIELYGPLNAIKEIRIVMPIGTDKSAYQPVYDAFGG